MSKPRRISRAVLAALLLVLLLGPPVDATRIVANDSATIGDVRTVISAQYAYSSLNGARRARDQENFDGRLECLAAPRGCIPGYAKTEPEILDRIFVDRPTRHGYAFSFLAGPALDPAAARKAGASPTTVTSFTYVGVPLRPQSKYPDGLFSCGPGSTGRYGYCGDSTGNICYTPDGSMPPVKDGRCDPCHHPLH